MAKADAEYRLAVGILLEELRQHARLRRNARSG
jgi:hypothetical protein